jgi:hypothetical protein
MRVDPPFAVGQGVDVNDTTPPRGKPVGVTPRNVRRSAEIYGQNAKLSRPWCETIPSAGRRLDNVVAAPDARSPGVS